MASSCTRVVYVGAIIYVYISFILLYRNKSLFGDWSSSTKWGQSNVQSLIVHGCNCV